MNDYAEYMEHDGYEPPPQGEETMIQIPIEMAKRLRGYVDWMHEVYSRHPQIEASPMQSNIIAPLIRHDVDELDRLIGEAEGD